MQLESVLLLLLGTSAVAEQGAFRSNSQPRGLGSISNAFPFGPVKTIRQTSCLSTEIACGEGCIPEDGDCCDSTAGTWCDPGDSCTLLGGCCPDGEICTGAPEDCKSGKTECGEGCIPSEAECCDDAEGLWCDIGDSCTSTGCSSGSGGGGSGGGSGGGDDDDDDDDDGSSGDGGGDGSDSLDTCPTGFLACEDSCMLTTSICCNRGDGTSCPNTKVCSSSSIGLLCCDRDDPTCSGNGRGSMGNMLIPGIAQLAAAAAIPFLL